MPSRTQDFLVVGGISLSYLSPETDALEKGRQILRKAGLHPDDFRLSIYKKSVDARKKADIRILYSVSAEWIRDGALPGIRNSRMHELDLSLQKEEPVTFAKGSKQAGRPVVVGMGPAGLFAALVFSEQGYAPIVLERGEDVAARAETVHRFTQKGELDPDSNIQFGAGGAGAFSDGKLMTRIHDPFCGYVLHRLCEFGAPSDILVQSRPHIGTDCLQGVVDRILHTVAEKGGELRYRCRYIGSRKLTDGTAVAETEAGSIPCAGIILAIGNSARDTYLDMIRTQYVIEAKPISVGARIEHLRRDVEFWQYGQAAGHPALGAAEYHLSDTTGERGVYTFCMCPGGVVVPAASEPERLVTNGMSYHSRDGRNSNAALVVSVLPEDVSQTGMTDAESMIAFQREIEHRGFLAGGEDWNAPIQTVGDFLEDRYGTLPTLVIPTYREGLCRPANLAMLFPKAVTDGLRRGIRAFDRRIPGFAMPQAVLTAPETRTSAPVRILRHEDRTAIGHPELYPCGEGAGYAGGIMSAAVDGLRTALAFMAEFAPK